MQPLWLVPESSGKDPDGADSVPCLAWKDVPGSSCTCLGSALESAISDDTPTGRLAGAGMSHVKTGNGLDTSLL